MTAATSAEPAPAIARQVWHRLKVGRTAPILVVLACLLVVGCDEKQETAEVVRPVRAMKVQDVEGFQKRFFPGRAAATQEINASFRVSGQLIKRTVDVGSEVK